MAPTHFEVRVSHPGAESYRRQYVRSANAFLEEVWDQRLRRDYGGGPPAAAPYDLIPAVVSTYGGWHPAFVQWLKRAVREAAERQGPTASPASMLWRTVGFLSVSLQRSNFQI